MKEDDEDLVKEFLDRFEREVLPELKTSAITVGIFSGEVDAKMCLEIGASVLLEKPLIMLVTKGAYIPVKLRALATEIVEVTWPMNERDEAATQAALKRVSHMLDRQRQ